jgi:hypothetical protein
MECGPASPVLTVEASGSSCLAVRDRAFAWRHRHIRRLPRLSSYVSRAAGGSRHLQRGEIELRLLRLIPVTTHYMMWLGSRVRTQIHMVMASALVIQGSREKF